MGPLIVKSRLKVVDGLSGMNGIRTQLNDCRTMSRIGGGIEVM